MRNRGFAIAFALSTCTPANDPPALRVTNLAVQLAEPEWARMSSPIMPPTSDDERERITVWLRVPRGALLRARYNATSNRWVLAYPPGTRAERLDARISGGLARIVDVRGTELLGSGEQFHVLRRDSNGVLMGYAWPRDDDGAREHAARSLLPLVESSGEDVSFFLAHVGCSRCHVPNASGNDRFPDATPPMPTDDAGFFRITTVLEDSTPLVESRDHDVNLDSSFVTVTCASGPATVMRSTTGTARARCPAHEVPVATYDMAAAMAARDVHAHDVCVSRAYLFSHLDQTGRNAFDRAFDTCNLR